RPPPYPRVSSRHRMSFGKPNARSLMTQQLIVYTACAVHAKPPGGGHPGVGKSLSDKIDRGSVRAALEVQPGRKRATHPRACPQVLGAFTMLLPHSLGRRTHASSGFASVN